MPDVDFIRPCGVAVFALFYCRLDLCCGECYVGCLQLSVSLSMCLFVMCCLLNAFAICVAEVNVFFLKVMVFFLVG